MGTHRQACRQAASTKRKIAPDNGRAMGRRILHQRTSRSLTQSTQNACKEATNLSSVPEKYTRGPYNTTYTSKVVK